MQDTTDNNACESEIIKNRLDGQSRFATKNTPNREGAIKKMADEQVVVQPTVTPTVTEVPPVVTPPTPKTFTQQELDNIVKERLERERKSFYKRIGVEDDTKIDEVLTRAKEYDTLKSERDALKSEKVAKEYQSVLTKLNIDDSFIDYALTKIEKGATIEEFEANAKAFAEANPKLNKENFQRINSGLDLNGDGPVKIPTDTKEYVEWRKTHNIDGTLIKKK